MNEVDDRIAGDPVWELFPYPAPFSSSDGVCWPYRRWLGMAVLITVGWAVYPPLAFVTVCLAVAARDFRNGRRLARSIPDDAVGTICSRFAYAWGAWKLGVAAVALTFVTITTGVAVFKATGWSRPGEGALACFGSALLLMAGGFAASAGLTTAGLVAAYRSGMRVWVGDGVNQARTLLLAMLIVGFSVVVLGPICVWLAKIHPGAGDAAHAPVLVSLVLFIGCVFVGPVVLLIVLDWITRHVVADRPGKFGPKVPTVGKWTM